MSVVPGTLTSTPQSVRWVGRRRAIGAASALLAVIVSSWSHLRGGGSSSGIVDLLPLLIGAPIVGAVLGRRRWSFGASLSALVVLQPAVHVTMTRHGAGMDDSPSPRDIAMPMVEHGTSPWAMVAMHAVGVVIVAVTVRYGWQWVSTMPALLAAAVDVRRHTMTWRTPRLSMLAVECFRAPLAPRRIANWSRGPPR